MSITIRKWIVVYHSRCLRKIFSGSRTDDRDILQSRLQLPFVMSDDEKNPHNNLYYYGGMLLLGVIVLILGLQQLNWIISLVGGLLAAFGGFEVKINYTKIQNEENTIRAKQNGHHNTQVNQTSP